MKLMATAKRYDHLQKRLKNLGKTIRKVQVINSVKDQILTPGAIQYRIEYSKKLHEEQKQLQAELQDLIDKVSIDESIVGAMASP